MIAAGTPNAISIAAIVQAVIGTVGTAFFIYLATISRNGIRKFMGEHRDLIRQTKQNTDDIKHNQEDIKRILNILEAQAYNRHWRR